MLSQFWWLIARVLKRDKANFAGLLSERTRLNSTSVGTAAMKDKVAELRFNL